MKKQNTIVWYYRILLEVISTTFSNMHNAYSYAKSVSILSIVFPGGSEGQESACNAEDLDSKPGSGRSPGEGNDNPLQYSCLENPIDRGAWCGRLQSIVLQKVRHDWTTNTFAFIPSIISNNNFLVCLICWNSTLFEVNICMFYGKSEMLQ